MSHGLKVEQRLRLRSQVAEQVMVRRRQTFRRENGLPTASTVATAFPNDEHGAIERETALLEWIEKAARLSDPTPLVSAPSEITQHALRTIKPWALYHILKLESLSASEHQADKGPSIAAQRQQRAKQELQELEAERDRWLKVERLLREASALAARAKFGARLPDRLHPEPGELLPDDVRAFAAARGYRSPEDVPGRHIDLRCLPATFVINWIADDARTIASGHSQPFWNDSERAKAAIEQSTKATVWLTRARIKFLYKRLKQSDPWWTIPRLSELVLASRTDWDPPPVVLASTCSDYKKLKIKIENLLNPRSNRAR
jgi:hypothetical protein